MRIRKIEKLTLILLITGVFVIYLVENWTSSTVTTRSKMKTKFKDRTWIRVSNDVYVYSAFTETRGTKVPYVKMVGLKRMRKREDGKPPPTVQDITKVKDVADINSKYFCKLFYINKDTLLMGVKSENLTYFVFEEGVKIFAGVFYKCYFPEIPLNLGPLYVALYPLNVKNYPDKLLRVQVAEGREGTSENEGQGVEGSENHLSVCVRPLFGPMDDLLKIVQFIAYYEAMGADSFTFYALSLSWRVREFLEQLNSVKLMTWNLPTGNFSELWDYGTLAALHDCVSQSGGKGFVAVVDIDEFIVPQQDSFSTTTLKDLVTAPEYQHIDQFVFHNVFFCEEFCKDQQQEILTDGEKQERNSSMSEEESWVPAGVNLMDPISTFPIFSCTLRTKRVWGTHDRTKYILRAGNVLTLGHHYVTTYVSGDVPIYSPKTLYVPPSTALLNHYRDCSSVFSKRNPVVKRTRVEDRKILSFKQRVQNSLVYQVFANNLIL